VAGPEQPVLDHDIGLFIIRLLDDGSNVHEAVPPPRRLRSLRVDLILFIQ